MQILSQFCAPSNCYSLWYKLVWHAQPLCTSENGSGDTDIQYQFLPSESEGKIAVQVVINS